MPPHAPIACAICTRHNAQVGVLCEPCRDRIASTGSLLPEQILAAIAKPTAAALIDQWGRPHHLEARTVIGRTIERTGLQLLEASISRQHASIERDGKAWTLRDHDSANGTFLNDKDVDLAPIVHGDRVRLGQVDFYFVPDAGALPTVEIDSLAITTARPPTPVEPRSFASPDETTGEHLLPIAAAQIGEDAGLPIVKMRLIEPTGGGGGLLVVNGIEQQLTVSQFEIFTVLAKRMLAEAGQPSQVRGFVRSSELRGSVSWETRDPDDNHLKQLLRRMRRALVRSGIGDLLEARHRFGYRLRVIPQE